MKTLRHLCFVVVLAMMFAIPTMGGDTQGPSATTPGQTDTPINQTSLTLSANF